MLLEIELPCSLKHQVSQGLCPLHQTIPAAKTQVDSLNSEDGPELRASMAAAMLSWKVLLVDCMLDDARPPAALHTAGGTSVQHPQK